MLELESHHKHSKRKCGILTYNQPADRVHIGLKGFAYKMPTNAVELIHKQLLTQLATPQVIL